MPHPGHFILQKETQYLQYMRLGGLKGPVCTGAGNLTPNRVPAPNFQNVVSHYANYTILATL